MQAAAKTMPELHDGALLCTQACINGAWTDAASAATFEVGNPADGATIASVPNRGV